MSRIKIPKDLFSRELDQVVDEVTDQVLNHGWSEYIARVRKVESLPENQSGTDKTWVEEALGLNRLHYGKARGGR